MMNFGQKKPIIVVYSCDLTSFQVFSSFLNHDEWFGNKHEIMMAQCLINR